MTALTTAEEMTKALRLLVLGPEGARLSTADGLVAASLLKARPDPLAVPRQLSELAWDEELPDSHWPLDDDTLFYAPTPPAGGAPSKAHFDLNIAMPVVLPDAQLRVANSEGENYYHSPSSPAANLLFGHYDDAPGAAPPTAPAAGDFPTAAPVPAAERPPISICDVWASFLRIQLGTVRNCRADQIQEVTEIFLSTLGRVRFSKPIQIQCAGVYQGAKNRLETRAKFSNADDLAHFRVIRRALKLFVLRVRERFALAAERAPVFAAALSPVCKTGAYLPIEIRRYSFLDRETLDLVKGGRPTVDLPVAGVPTTFPLQVDCLLHDLRLEMTHARAVDPRWTDAWVLCRRMPMNALITPARQVFADLPRLPQVLYHFPNPKATLTKSRFGTLYMLTESALHLNKHVLPPRPPLDAPPDHTLPSTISPTKPYHHTLNDQPLNARLNITEHPMLQLDHAGSQLRAEAIPFFPITALSQVLQSLHLESANLEAEQRHHPTTTWEKLVESALTRDHNPGLDLLNALRAGTPAGTGSYENAYHHNQF